MTNKQKAEILLNTARAYLARGGWVQYDQLSMDRIVRCSPRRSAFAPPEAGTADEPLFLDCSSFIWNCYYQTFDYMLPADLTWHMIDVLPDRVFYYEPTHEESAEEQAAICRQVRELLEPGDIVTIERVNHSGHTMLYAGDGRFIHSTQKHGFNGYKYEEKRNIWDPEGTVGEDSCERWFTPWDGSAWTKLYLLRDNVKRFSVHRPLDHVGDPAEQALVRFGAAKDLVCSITASVKPGQTVPAGNEICYTVDIRNDSEDTRIAEIEFRAGEGSALKGSSFQARKLEPGETDRAEFICTVNTEGWCVEKPVVTVNGLTIEAPRILVGPAAEDIAPDAAFPDFDISEELHRLFFLHDTELGDVVSRRPQRPLEDGCVYGLYGGIGVITPQNASGAKIRTTHIARSYLQPGDLILCADDALFIKSYGALWTGDALRGRLEWDAAVSECSGADADRWIDALPGRFCYAVLRPGLKRP